jgi:hypothetical protein
MRTPSPAPAVHHRNATPILLGVIAALLGLNLVTTVMVGPGALEPRAVAQNEDPNPTGFVAAAEQRKQMIAELKNLAARMERIEATMKSGINVKVLSMPETAAP